MKVSLNSIQSMNKRYDCAGDIAPDGARALAEKIGAQLGGIDEIIEIGAKYHGAVIVKVVSCAPHPDSDHMHVCRVDDGGVTKDVQRGEDGLVQVVCGAPNVHDGMLAVWLPPGSTVPESVGTAEPFVLGARELRGVTSNGMLASLRELALGEEHDGILEIDNPHGEIKPGNDFAEIFGLKDDVVFDIENKMFTHRPDCFGFLGVSRELAGIQNMPFKSPEWYRIDPELPAIEAEALTLQVRNETPSLVPRFTMIGLRDVNVGKSPVWLQVELAKVGLRSINNIVDYTNFFMLETGQPLHAYDYDKVKARSGDQGVTIVIRHPHENEQITLLNGKTITPRSEAIMIATDKELIGLAGVMGGGDTEVDANTKNILIEVATFDMYSIRRTSMAHGLFTDAVTRFNKGQSPLQNLAVLAKIVDEIRKHDGGKIASNLIDVNDFAGREWVHPPVPITAAFINERLGLSLSAQEIETLLQNVEFKTHIDGETITVTAPFWRTDVETREDVVEEVGRLYGFDKLPLELPKRSITPVQKDQTLELKNTIRATLAKAGANEVLGYSFVHGNLLEKVGQDKELAFALSNALSPDLQYYRLSLTPSLLANVHPNIKTGYDEFALFEIGKAHAKSELDDEGLPVEFERVALVFAAEAKHAATAYAGAAYYQALAFAEDLLQEFGIRHKFQLIPLHQAELGDHPVLHQMVAVYEPTRSAAVFDGERVVGVVGEFKLSVSKALKLPEYAAGFELYLRAISENMQKRYVPLSRFPKLAQDITLKVPADVPYQKLYDFVAAEVAKVQPEHTLPVLTAVDIYQKPDDPEHRQITLRLTIASYQKTLTDPEVTRMLEAVMLAARETFGAEQV
jgi:phenylalanyl-tRNA synthetase beta chain